ncbi:hypothetical protein DL769_008780 [Monosporascus sp. CRB-8-3]|nr:hypothetical protein DL769_008780 [Monosporascus sp. CRB-8-3]
MALLAALTLFICAVLSVGLLRRRLYCQQGRTTKVPVSVIYHFTRRCNKTCGFCFYTATTSHIEDLSRQEALLLLAKAGMRKVNFAGGEAFLCPRVLGAMVNFCKFEL